MKRNLKNNATSILIKEIFGWTVLLVLSFVYVLFSSIYTSPFYPGVYGGDTEWYQIMGKSLVQGCIPYKDYFDLKGPVWFFIQGAGQLINPGKSGVFIFQVISAVISSFFVWKTSRMYIGRLCSVFVLVITGFVGVPLLWGGNTVEEILMPFNMAAVYFTLRFFEEYYSDQKTKNGLHLRIPSFVLGFGFSSFILSKATVSAITASGVLIIFISFIRRGDWKNIWICFKYFIAGMFLVIIPVFVYFLVNGALTEFIGGTFITAFQRGVERYGVDYNLDWEAKTVICWAAFFYGVCMNHKNTVDKYIRYFILMAAFAEYIILHLGTPYLYYFLAQLPLLSILCVFYIRDIRDEFRVIVEHIRNKEENDIQVDTMHAGHRYIPDLRLVVFTTMMFLIIFNYFFLFFDSFEQMKYAKSPGYSDIRVSSCKEILSFIPEKERNEVLCFDPDLTYYVVTDTLPDNKYPFNMSYFMSLDPSIKNYEMNKLVNNPKWIICQSSYGLADDDMYWYFVSNYEKVAFNDSLELWCYAGEKA